VDDRPKACRQGRMAPTGAARRGVSMQGWPEVAQVVVDGRGPVADELVAQLRRCEVLVLGGTHAADGAELALAVGEAAPDVVVVVAQGRAPRWAGAPWQARGIPHLPVVVGTDRVVVGPLVLPGRTACLRCAEGAWRGPRLLRTGTDGTGTGSGDVPAATVILACAVATVTILTTLRGDASLGGISTEIGLSDVSLAHRLWNVRPDCGCARVRMAG
jgi:hypothetical protein